MHDVQKEVRIGIFVKLTAKSSTVCLVIFVKLIFIQSNIICIGPFIYSASEVNLFIVNVHCVFLSPVHSGKPFP